MATRIQLRRDTTANWAAENPILASGEFGFETDSLKRVKVGDGTTAWNALASLKAAAADLSGTTLPASIVTSSLTAVGTIASGVWQGTPVANDYIAQLTAAGKVANSATTATASNTASAIVARDASGDFTARNITATLFNGPAASANEVAVANVTGLLSGGKILSSLLPALAISETSVVVSQVAMLALTAQKGDVAVRSDVNKSFILAGDDPSVLGNWQELLTPTDAVLSVAGRVGAVTLVSADITDATSSNTASRVVVRDASGNFAGNVVTATSLVGTLATAAQPNITSVGVLAAPHMSAPVVDSGGLVVNGGISAGSTVVSLVNSPDSGLGITRTAAANTTDECYIAMFAIDAGTNSRKVMSISSKWVNTNATNGYSVTRYNSDYIVAGVTTDDIQLRLFGGHGAAFFGPDDATSPGDKILKIHGRAIVAQPEIGSGTNVPAWTVTTTWNSGGTAFTGILFNATNTASLATSLLADLQVDGASIWKVDRSGDSTQAGAGNFGARVRIPYNIPLVSVNQAGNSAYEMLKLVSFGAVHNIVQLSPDGQDVVVGAGADIATNATLGFLCVPSCNGTPTGVPAIAGNGRIPLVYDRAADMLWAYRGSWRGAAVT